jgi:hypothetical protein
VSDEYEDTETTESGRPGWVLPVIALVLAVGVAGWLWLRKSAPPPAPVTVAETNQTVISPPDSGVQHPLSDVEGGPSDAPVPLPTLEESDAPLVADLSSLLGAPRVSTWLVPDGLVRRFVATVDNLAREKVAEKVRVARPVPGAVEVERAPLDAASGEERITLSAANYARYEPAVQVLTALDMRKVGVLYRSYYPLLQQAYEDLGYPGRYFNDRLVEVIDHLIATPIPAQPPELTHPKAMYEFADASLERRSAGQKMLIRMGPQNAAQVKERLRALRAEIARSAPRAE